MAFFKQPSWNNQAPRHTAVVMGTYNRGHLLMQSLWHYVRTMEAGDCLVIIDDGSTDNTEDVVKWYAEGMKAEASGIHGLGMNCDIFYFRLEKEPGTWRDSAEFLNMGISFALNALRCQNVFITHPEIIPGEKTLHQAKHLANMQSDRRVWVSAKGYYLTMEQQAYLMANWEEMGANHDLLKVRDIPGFYVHPGAPIEGPAADYVHTAMDKHKVWQSWIWGGGNRMMWSYLGGVNESKFWGVVDVDLLNRRNALNMLTVTPSDDTAMVVHQNHDDPNQNVVTPRDMDAVFANMPKRPMDEYRAFLDPKRWMK